MITIHESTRKDGSFERIGLVEKDGVMALVDDAGSHALPPGALAAVMKRYGKELAGALPEVASDARISFADGSVLVRFRHLATFDVIAKDYLAYAAPGAPIVCELAASVTAALAHLARAVVSKRP